VGEGIRYNITKLMPKIILVTGANRGIGLEICRQLGKIGHTVILTARNEEKGREAIKKITGDVVFHVLDVTSQASVDELFHNVNDEYGRLDVLINNAGIVMKNTDLSLIEIEDVKVIMETNFYGPMRMNKAFTPLLQKSDDARIINVSSSMGSLANLTGGYAGYRLSKIGLNAQTILLSYDLKRAGIKVFSMCPGWVKTDMGGTAAPRPVTIGADTAVWLSLEKNLVPGKFYRDRKIIQW
jgi:NAD(P)-dependent dehydrogenase (short-subunit alcohol dehydrogenase family)